MSLLTKYNSLINSHIHDITKKCDKCSNVIIVQVTADEIRVLYHGIMYYSTCTSIVDYAKKSTICGCHLTYVSNEICQFIVYKDNEIDQRIIFRADITSGVEQYCKGGKVLYQFVQGNKGVVINQSLRNQHEDVLMTSGSAGRNILEILPVDDNRTKQDVIVEQRKIYQLPAEVITAVFECVSNTIDFKYITVLMKTIGITPREMLTDEFLNHAVKELSISHKAIDEMIIGVIKQQIDPDIDVIVEPDWTVSHLAAFQEERIEDYYNYLIDGVQALNFSYVLDQLSIGMIQHPIHSQQYSRELIVNLLDTPPEEGIEYKPIIAKLLPFI